MNAQQEFAQASMTTADDLRSVAHSFENLSLLSLPEIDAVVEQISQLVPAGNVPGVILNGLARLPGRRPPVHTVTRDLNLLFKGVEAALDKAVYGAFFAGPAAVIWGYQNLLKLAGKDPEHTFPNGLWQYYVEYAFREDSARHAIETGGFDVLLDQHEIKLHPVDRISAWLMAAIEVLHQYPDLLANEWRERIYISVLQGVTADTPLYANLYRDWERQRPYGRGHDAEPQHNFATYRRHKFDQFLSETTQQLNEEGYQAWTQQLQGWRQALKDYQQQMSIHSYLQPGPYGETRIPLAFAELCVGLIYNGRYYLLPVLNQENNQPLDIVAVRENVASILALPTGKTAVDLSNLAPIKRASLADLRRDLNKTLASSLQRLQYAPILFNADQRPVHLTLPEIRQAERGIGDNALTLFDTGQTIVFDQSQIYFDEGWGAALAEIFTREAMSWAVYLKALSPPSLADTIVKPLTFPLESAEQRFVEQAPRIAPEVSAETDKVNLQMLLTTRSLLKKRNQLLTLAVNDLLILYRAIHAVTYQPDPNLMAKVDELTHRQRNRKAAESALASLQDGRNVNPAILIPIDASRFNPKERLYPLVFEAPLRELDLLELHSRTLEAHSAHKNGEESFEVFAELKQSYLATIASFGQLFRHAKEIVVRGESASAGSIRLLANIPAPLQHLLDALPSRFDILNDVIKGPEIFSNIGQVMPGSTLSRFCSAKDDYGQKGLAWGILTDRTGVMRITLRDFRPHVAALTAIGYRSLAGEIAQHYLDSYTAGVNAYILELRHIIMADRKSVL